MTNSEQFINDLFQAAVKIESKYKIPHTVLLSQAALETGWGQSIPDGSNMYFGIKAGDSWKGNRILITTTEFLPYNTGYTFPQVLSITPSGTGYLWKVKDWFRSYPTPYASLKDYAELLTTQPAYNNALQFSQDPDQFIDQLGAYATDPNYISKLKDVRQSVINKITSLDLKKKLVPGIGILLLLGISFYLLFKR